MTMAEMGSMVVMVDLDEASLALINRVKGENKRLQAKLDRATKRIASMVRERETMLTQKETAGLMQALYDEACAREKAEKERDEWKAKAEAALVCLYSSDPSKWTIPTYETTVAK